MMPARKARAPSTWKPWVLAGCILLQQAKSAAASEHGASAAEAYCRQEFGKSLSDPERCSQFLLDEACVSEEKVPIPHYQREGTASAPVRVLVFGQIHGDEFDAGTLALNWIERLGSLAPKNTWRIVPRLNPDGFHARTRMNARGVDLNRNFPTKDWDSTAKGAWKQRERSNPRRYPGPTGGSEAETRCAIRQLESFKPDVIVSIHSPYGLLDLDGKAPKFLPKFGLPWKNLGTFPGSLGRYMWTERGVPVLTIELAPSSLKTSPAEFGRLQDFISLLAPGEEGRGR